MAAQARKSRLARRLHRRAGVSLVEVCIVVCIFGLMAAMASQSMSGMLPSWRVKRVAKEFMVECQQARDLAIAQGVEYRVLVDTWDTDPAGGETSYGRYKVQRGNLGSSECAATPCSDVWDTLPVDEGGVVNDGQGVHEFTRGTPNGMPWVSFQEPRVAAIVFDSRGFLESSSADFDSSGTINFVFLNKRALVVDGMNEWWQVSISRAGFARLSGTYSTPIGAPSGTSGTTNFPSSSGSGYVGG